MALTLGAYAIIDVRAGVNQRRTSFEKNSRQLATALRASLEARGVQNVLAEADDLAKEISKSSPWQVQILPRAAALRPAKPGTEAQIRRLKTMLEVRPRQLTEHSNGHYIYALPLRVQSLSSPDGYRVAGILEVSRSMQHLAPADRADLRRTIPVIAVIVMLTVLAIFLMTRAFVTRPIEKLLAGIDDVAKGDLSRVLLSERDDEVGELATRFNEMTTSLRESQAETKRQNEAKLNLEQRLGQTEKLATIGQLAAEIAHEVGTPLNVIAGRARNLGKKADRPDAVKKNAQVIAEQTGRITRIIQRLLDFTRRKVGAPAVEQVNLNEVTLTTMEFLAGQFSGARVKTRLDRAEGLPPVQGSSDRLQQVLINLLLNSVQAMPDGGTLTVETGSVTRRRPGLEMEAEAKYVVLEITDNGVGIPADQRDKIFEPFYTSKTGSGGTGLGLAVCHGIVKEHDGWIEVTDAPESGTIFRVYLPAAAR